MDDTVGHLLTSADGLGRNSTIALYGAGDFGRQVLAWRQEKRPDLQVACILDTTQSGEAMGLPLVRADEYAKGKNQVDAILITSHFAADIAAHLESLGITNYFVFDRSIMGLLIFSS